MLSSTLETKLKNYVELFNRQDNGLHPSSINNSCALDWLCENAPRIECPDQAIESAYYFRLWTFRKHVKPTPDGNVVTEFLPPVPWDSLHNTIVAAVGHHVDEGKWLKNRREVLEDYLALFLTGKSSPWVYSTWICYSVWQYCRFVNDYSFGLSHLEDMVGFYTHMAQEHATDTGLFWSYDNCDAMEVSISGSDLERKATRGLRPTLNSYMAANAFAICQFARLAGKEDLAQEYDREFQRVRDTMFDRLFDGEFFKACHSNDEGQTFPTLSELSLWNDARELIGYIPWCFDLVPPGHSRAFSHLKTKEGFLCQYGLTTAEQRHPRFLFGYRHSCLWNGFVWPFATTQTLNAVRRVLASEQPESISWDDYYQMLHTYADTHHRILPDGSRVFWIDEVRNPWYDVWESRHILEARRWPENHGPADRGKDYNHSTFCDLVLGGLLGIDFVDGVLQVEPHVPQDWEYFKVENLWMGNKQYHIFFDRNGTRYGMGKGLTVQEQ